MFYGKKLDEIIKCLKIISDEIRMLPYTQERIKQHNEIKKKVAEDVFNKCDETIKKCSPWNKGLPPKDGRFYLVRVDPAEYYLVCFSDQQWFHPTGSPVYFHHHIKEWMEIPE